jgi:hypothetical protein
MPTASEQFETYEQIVQGRHHERDIVVETQFGELEFTISPLPRTERWEYISKLPSGMFENAEELDEDETLANVDSASMIPDGQGAEAFENMVIESLGHETLQPTEIREMVTDAFSDELVFELGAEVLELSTDVGNVKSFRRK